MDKSAFTSKAPGKLVPFNNHRRDWSFVPDPMPPKWDFAPELWPLLVEAKEALGTLNGIGQTLPDPQLLLKPLQNREALASSSIEGTYVTPEQLLLYQLDPREPQSTDDKRADWLEVFNYNRALQHGCELLKDLPLCNRLIKEMHGILMRGVRGRDKSPGAFRNYQVQIGSKARFVPPPTQDVIPLMNNLETYLNSSDERFDPLVRCFIVHYQFETIHPFRDGNGRVGRALLALMIYKWLGHAMPWLYLSAYFERYREEYVKYLFNISAEGSWTTWVEFCLRGTIEQAHDSIRRCNKFHLLRSEFHTRLNDPSPRTHRIIEGLFAGPIVTIASLSKQFEVSYMTAKSDVDKLIKCGILRIIENEYPKSFYSHEIMRIAYGEDDVGTESSSEGIE